MIGLLDKSNYSIISPELLVSARFLLEPELYAIKKQKFKKIKGGLSRR
jgi:hypothetical protein